jgi:hypothetical protein
MERLLFVALILILTGCASPKPVKTSTLLADTPTGSVLSLHTSLPVLAHESVTSFQFGRLVTPSELDRWHPYCEVVLKNRSAREKQIPRGNFRIKRVVKHTEPYSGLKQTGRHMLASAGSDLYGLYSGQQQTWLYKTSFHLESGGYSDVKQFFCGQLRNGYTENRISMLQFQQAVGSYLSIDRKQR